MKRNGSKGRGQTRRGVTASTGNGRGVRRDNAPQPSGGTGYGRPPVHSRWQTGQSGNPKGRPKKSKNLATQVRETLNGSVVMNERGHKRRVPYLVAILLKQIESALKGSEKAAFAVIKIYGVLGLLAQEEGERTLALSDAEQAMIDEVMSQINPKSEKSNEQ